MDFNYTEEQQMLANTVADFVSKESPLERARELRDDETGWSKDVWKKMGELGWLSVPFAEEYGGFGGTFVDAAIVAEQLGKTLVPEPFVVSVILCGAAISDAGSEEQKQDILPRLISGDISLAFAASETENRYEITSAKTKAAATGERYSLTGTKTWVENGHAADILFVTAQTENGIGLFIVNKDQAESTRVQTIDGRSAATVMLNNADADLLGDPGASTELLLGKIFDHGAAACCAEGLGVAQVAFDMTIEYMKTREQFNTKIGAFQALQHRAVDMYIENQLLKAATMASTIRVTESDAVERRKAVSAAKKQLAVGGKYVTRQSIQLHGGIGCTDEHDIGLYFKRMHALNVMFGDEAWHENRYANE